MTIRGILIWATSATVAASLIGCGSDSSTGSTSNTGGNNTSGGSQVQALTTFAFNPGAITITPGQSVSWVFYAVGHTVTFDPVAGAPANIGDVNDPNVNTTVSRTFATKGTYTYHCSIHPSMTGVVYVGTSASSSDTSHTTNDTTSNPYGRRQPNH